MNRHADTSFLRSAPIRAYDLGVAPYIAVQELQRRIRADVAASRTQGVLLLLEHPPVISVGANASKSDILSIDNVLRRGVQIADSERGGQCTLHAPGQLVAYPVIPIPRRDLRAYVHDLEEVLILLLAFYDLPAQRLSGRPGLYLHGKKIASLGLRCQHGIASHGSALNVDIDLSLFDLLTSCGDPHLLQTSMSASTGRAYDINQIKTRYVSAFQEVFRQEVLPVRECRRLSALGPTLERPRRA